MKKTLTYILVALALVITVNASGTYSDSRKKIVDCQLRGKKLYGRVRIVSNFADFRVRVVTSFEDLRVKQVNAFPNTCGRWQLVGAFEDFTVQFVEAFEDFTIKYDYE